MKVYIPTRSRPQSQRAYQQMTAARYDPILVIDDDQKELYKKHGYNYIVTRTRGIAAARQAALKHAGKNPHVVMDDDTTFAAVDVQPDGKVTIDKNPTPMRLRKEIARAEELLQTMAHGGVHTRHFVNYAEKPYEMNRGYPRQIMFFNPKNMPRVPVYSGETAEDVRFFLECLEQGLDYFILTSCCMIETKSKELRTHFTQDGKNNDMIELSEKYAEWRFPTSFGSYGLRYAAILKHFKAARAAQKGRK